MQNINKIKEYFQSMDIYEGRWVITVKYRPKWGAYSSDDGRIKVGPDERTPDVWLYCAADDTVEVDEIIDLIEETVQTNLEAIKKVELFKLKANELKQLFSDESISFKKLQTLKFVFDASQSVEETTKPVKEVTKKKASSKKDLMSQVGEVIQEHDVFSTSTPEEAPEEKPVRKKRESKPKAIETATPVNMSQEEIDALRG